MEHETIVESLSEYRDGVLPAADRAEIARHLVSCASCTAALADWDRLAGAFLRRPPQPTAEESALFAARVMARLSELDARASLRDILSAPWLAPAAAMALGLLVLSFIPYSQQAPSEGAGTALLEGPPRHPLVAWVSGQEPAAADDPLGLSADEQ